MRALTLLLLMVCLPVASEPLTATEDTAARIAAERQRLERQRQAIEQDDLSRQRDCWQRFAVNDCLREARRLRHAALDPLRALELDLNAQERAWRTQQRDQRLREKSASPENTP